MSDVLRAAKIAPGVVNAADVWLIETSEPLRARQRERLGEAHWAASLDEVPVGIPIILIANEFLDCLPVRQFVRTDRGWAERLVGVSDDGLAFGYAPSPPPIPDLPGGPTGEVLEVASAQEAFAEVLAARIARDGGAALLIDYGRDAPGFGDTLQALKAHEKVDPLGCPGEADLTFHVDFPTLLAAARTVGPQTALATQGAFLRGMGIEQRAAALSKARPDQADKLARQLDRLIGPDQMGELFKAATIHSPGLAPPGFEEAP
jgi:SAM-dependent MidA family methyltransferase